MREPFPSLISEEIFTSEYSSEGDEEECGDWPLPVNPTRTTALIIDYKLFIAARRIQSNWRGHRVRKLWDQRWQAAIAIQRWWRGFWLRRHLWDQLERRLQETLLDHYHRAATRIQALFRGWQVRRHVHDMHRLSRTQTAAAEELIHCLSLRLHHLKQTEYLPGMNSMLESICMEKLEHLTTTMKFRLYNGRMMAMVARTMVELQDQRRHFTHCRFLTGVPYIGPNFNQCPDYPQDQDWTGVGDERSRLTDPRLLNIVGQYEDSQRNKHFLQMFSNSGLRKRKEYSEHIQARERRAKRQFCEEIIESMRGWKIWSGTEVEIPTDIFCSPESLKNFLEAVRPLLDKYGVNCYCAASGPVYNCPKTHG